MKYGCETTIIRLSGSHHYGYRRSVLFSDPLDPLGSRGVVDGSAHRERDFNRRMRNCCGELLSCCVKSQQGRNQTEPQALVIGLLHTAAATGYLKLGARYYNPTTGRFTQPDPSGKEPNTYNYASCNPGNNNDPSGRSACSDSIGGLFVGAASGAILMLGTNRYAPGPAIITIGAVGCAASFGWLMLRQHD